MAEEVEPEHGVIRLRIHEVTQLFNSLDPDPFIERDLDDDAVEYIRSWVREIPHARPLKLLVEITSPKLELDHQALVEGAVHNYFGHLADLSRNDFRQLMKRGRSSLIIGLTVLVVTVMLSRWLSTYEDWAFSRILQETVLIGGWVAMWRPMEIFLYDWWPLRRQRKDYERLRDMAVEVKLPTAAA